VVAFEDNDDVAEFKKAVRRDKLMLNNTDLSSLVNASKEDIAERLGLPKGLIRTAEQTYSITQRASKGLFGDSEENPARRQRMQKEMVHLYLHA